jgi:hypothetical protein
MVYGVIQLLHLVFGLFFALVAVCAIRGVSLHLWHAFQPLRPTPTALAPGSAPAPAPAT